MTVRERGQGVAHKLWLRVERERANQGMTKLDLWQKMKDRAGDGPSPARNTLDNLKTTTRAPQPRIVRAIADVLGIDWQEAQELAGLVPPATSAEVDVRDAIERSEYTEREKGVLLDLLDFIDAAHGRRP